MDKPLLSIVVPIYNIGQYLSQCLDSLVNQTTNNYEIVLVDDGSTDNSGNICDLYKKNNHNIKVIHKENGGLVSARKEGALISTGKYITCVDGDDWVECNYVEKIINEINKNEADIICFNYKCFDNNSITNINEFNEGYYDKKRIIKEIYPILLHDKNAIYFSPTIWLRAYKRDLYLNIQLQVDNKTTIAEDAACCLPCTYLANSISMISDYLYIYRKNQHSMTKGHKVFDLYYPKYIALQLRNTIDLNKYDLKEQYYRKIAHELFTSIVTQFYRNEKYNIIVKGINEALNDSIYKEVIDNCEYKNLKAKLMLFLLKYRLLLVIDIWSHVKGEF